MCYLSDCQVLYTRHETAICALEALALWRPPGKQAHRHLGGGAGVETSLQVMFAAALPISLLSTLWGSRRLCTSVLVGGGCASQNWGHGVGGSQQPGPGAHFIRPWTHTHDASVSRSSQVSEGIKLRNK